MKLGFSLALGSQQRGTVELPTEVPANLTAPTISGNFRVGDVQTASVGSWSNRPTSYAYQWTLDGAQIVGETGSTYTPISADLGSTLGVTVLASNAIGDAAAPVAASNPGTVLAQATAPTVTASDSLSGRVLTVTVDSSAGTPTPSLSIAMTLDGATVTPSGTGPWTYTVPNSASSQTVAWTVTATNSEGSATASGSEVVAANLAAPGQVTGLSVTAGNGQNALSWSAVTASPAVTDYVIEVSVGGGAYSTIADGGGSGTSYTHTGLTNGTAYTYRVSAVNSIGTGAASATVSATPAAGTVPDQVTGVSATHGVPSEFQATVEFTKPSDNGSPITSFEVEFTEPDSGIAFTETIAATSPVQDSVIIDLVVDAGPHEIRIAAVNANGQGPWSALVTSTESAASTPLDDVLALPGLLGVWDARASAGYLYEDRAGSFTTPATSRVGSIENLVAGGEDLLAPTDDARPTLDTIDGEDYPLSDGVDDKLLTADLRAKSEVEFSVLVREEPVAGFISNAAIASASNFSARITVNAVPDAFRADPGNDFFQSSGNIGGWSILSQNVPASGTVNSWYNGVERKSAASPGTIRAFQIFTSLQTNANRLYLGGAVLRDRASTPAELETIATWLATLTSAPPTLGDWSD